MLYIELEIILNGNQKPSYSQLIKSYFKLFQSAGFSGDLLFLLQLQELYLGRGIEKVFADFTFTYNSCCALDL